MTDEPSTAVGAARDPLAPRGSLGLILDRQFGAYFWALLLSAVGTWTHGIVAAIVIYAATGSALWVGLVSVAQFVPQLFLAPLSGTWADRGHLVRQLIVGRALSTAGSGFIGVWCWVDGAPQGYVGAAAVLLGSFVTGLGFAVGGPAQQAMFPLLIRPGELGTAMALSSLPMTIARVIGPAAGAMIMVFQGAALAFSVSALAHLAFIVVVAVTPLPAGPTQDTGVDLSIRASLRHVREDRTLLLLLLIVAGTGFASEPSMTLTPYLADKLGGKTELVGQLTAAFGLGAALGYPVYVQLSRFCSQPRVTQVGLTLTAVSTVSLAFAHTAPAALVSFGAVGVGFMVSLTAATTLIQERVPPTLRGRVMALWFMGFIGSRPVAAALDGWLTDTFSLAVALLFTAGLVTGLLLIFSPRRLDFSAEARQGFSNQT